MIVNWEIVVVSNNCTDKTQQVVADFVPDFPVPLRVVEANEKRGAAYARNVGVLQTKRDVIAFCDADDQVGVGWVQAAWDALNLDLDIVTGFVHGYSHQPSASDSTQIVRETNSARIPVPTCNCAFIKEAFLHIGGFDESFAKYGREDSELSIRARLAGLRIGFYPPMQVKFSPAENTLVLSRKLFQSGQAEVRMWARHPEVFPDQVNLSRVTHQFTSWASGAVKNPALMKNRQFARQGLISLGNVVGVLKGQRKGWGSPELIPPANRK